MSELTEEFRDLLVELAGEFGEGLTATVVERGLPAGSAGAPVRRYDPERLEYVTEPAGGDPIETTFACAPPRVEHKDGKHTTVLTMPRTERADGSTLVPAVGMHVRIGVESWQIGAVREKRIGNATYGYRLELVA